jgi:RHS repeat-associated protein
MVQKGDKTLTYGPENRLISVAEGDALTEFVYDGDGGRVKKQVTTGSETSTTTYIGSLFEITDGVVKKHIFAGANKVCTVEPEHTYYAHSDHLGSGNIITNETGSEVVHYEYQPYGQISQQTGSDVTNYKFTGKELDNTGFYFYSARYYDPEIGRFIQPDSIIQSPNNPQTLNRYTYCGNNPIRYVDPTGHFFGAIIAIVTAIVKAAAVGAAVGAVGAAITGGNIGQAAMMGAVAGAFTGGIGFLGVPGIISGAVAGSATAGIFGGNVGIGALAGAIGGGIGGYLGDWASGWSEGSFWGGLGAAAIAGGMAGGLAAELSGGSFGEGAYMGAACASGGYLGTVAISQLDPRYRKAKAYERAVRKTRALNVKKTDQIKVTVASRSLGNRGKTLGRHRFLEAWEMGPENPSGKIATSHTASDLSESTFPTHSNTQNAITGNTTAMATVEVSVSGLVEGMVLYEIYWGGGTSYNAFSYNSNYAVNTVVYSAGGNVPGGLGYSPGFGTTQYIPTYYGE